ncbi:hypothetical protein HDV05_004295 [Chytridiales sp. JEL 0842]|nr:hypothetical protein HDV05_004295 [Chytridiales sp. JEL 0842]
MTKKRALSLLTNRFSQPPPSKQQQAPPSPTTNTNQNANNTPPQPGGLNGRQSSNESFKRPNKDHNGGDNISIRSVSVPDLSQLSLVSAGNQQSKNSASGGSSGSKAFPRMVTPAQLKIGLQQVLDDQLEEPLSADSFYNFLKSEHSEENMEFYRAYKAYKASAEPYLTLLNAPANLSTPLTPREPSTPSTTEQSNNNNNADESQASSQQPKQEERPTKVPESLRQELNQILDTYFTPGTPKELNVPDKIRKKLIADIETDNVLHPEVLRDAVDNVCTMMRLSSFPSFYRAAVSGFGMGPGGLAVKGRKSIQG